MDWARAIERNSEALVGIVETLFVMLGLVGEATVARIPQPLHIAVLRLLRPAESALRRLLVIAARGLVVKLVPSRPMPAGPIGKAGRRLRFSFQLFDPRKNFEAPRRRAFARIAPAHPFLRARSPGGGPVASTPACARSRAAARWPRQCRAPQPEVTRPQAGA